MPISITQPEYMTNGSPRKLNYSNSRWDVSRSHRIHFLSLNWNESEHSGGMTWEATYHLFQRNGQWFIMAIYLFSYHFCSVSIIEASKDAPLPWSCCCFFHFINSSSITCFCRLLKHCSVLWCLLANSWKYSKVSIKWKTVIYIWQ